MEAFNVDFCTNWCKFCSDQCPNKVNWFCPSSSTPGDKCWCWRSQHKYFRGKGGHLISANTPCLSLTEVFKKQFRYFLCLQDITPSEPPLCVLLCKTNLYPHFFVSWKLNVWLEKLILHLVPSKNVCVLSCYNGPLLPKIGHSKEQSKKSQSASLKAVLVAVDMPNFYH